MVRFLFLIMFLFSPILAFAQTGEIQGKVTDGDTGEPIPFANVSLTVNGTLQGAQTDFDGVYSIKPLPAGDYDIEISYVGYQTSITEGVRVTADKITFLDITIVENSELLKEVVVKAYKIPVFEADQTSTGGTVTKEDIQNLPTRNVQSIASQTAAVYQEDEGSGLNLKGSRSNATDYYIDGIKVRGSSNLPASAIEQLTVVSGGVPARYGDATGGIINITTRGPSAEWHGGIELVTSKFLDAYDYYLGNFNLSGPLVKIKKGTPDERALFGFFLSGEYLHEGDDDPSAVGIYRVKDDVLQELIESPLVRSDLTSGLVTRSSYLTADDFEKHKARKNVEKDNISIAGKVDFQPIPNINITFGGQYNRNQGGLQRRSGGFKNFMRRWDLYNWEHMPQVNSNVYRVYGRFTQRFAPKKAEEAAEGEEGGKSGFLQNAFYSVQFDYTKSRLDGEDPVFGDNLFHYGYVGKFDVTRDAIYNFGSEGNLSGWKLEGYQDIRVDFEGSDINPVRSNHTEQYFELSGDDPTDVYENLTQIRNGNGIINGQVPSSLSSSYSLWNLPGEPYNTFQKIEDDQYRMTFNGSFDLKPSGSSDRNKHAVEFGFEYEQRVDRLFLLSPVDQLWDIMAAEVGSFANNDISLDTDNPILVIDGERIPVSEYTGVGTIFSHNDTITYDLVRTNETYFDKRFREKFGYGSLDFVDVHSVDPNELSLDMLTPDELYNGGGGSSVLEYRGYDHTGQKLSSQPAFEDFWTARDANDEYYTRPIGAFRPVYMAGYVQDKFAFRDMLFNVGVRVDRFDANQKVPKDIYVPLNATRKAGELDAEELDDLTNGNGLPATIGEDYVLYVNDELNPTQILGYRDGDVWYNSNGLEVSDPTVLQAGASVKPYLVDNTNIKSEEYDPTLSFEDYKPQVTVMPRIAFSFQISDEAVFFAHYDILSQRPQDRLEATPYTYYYFAENALFGVLENPNMKPERTIDYQIGFKQKLSQSSAITLSGFYRELKDLVQVMRVTSAYPREYRTYGNRDFGTVKGFEVSYDMRRTNNIRLSANYTMQFAEGTGSGDRSQLDLIDAGKPNLRAIFPLDYDSRHMLNLNIDYRFDEGKDYNGPYIGEQPILANFGVNLTARTRSGEPYTRQSNATPEAQFGVANRAGLDGTVNGSRLPWNFRLDLRVDKDFKLAFGENKGKKAKYLNVYFLVLNLLNTQNVVDVYEYTASPDDDGFLNSPIGQANSETQTNTQSFIDQYGIKVNDPHNFSIPRRMRLGLAFNF